MLSAAMMTTNATAMLQFHDRPGGALIGVESSR
jgi:hypothetical protein